MKPHILTLFLALLFTVVACDSTDDAKLSQNGTASLQVALIDNPATYEAVLIEVIGFQYQMSEGETSEADSLATETEEENDSTGTEWISASIEPTVYDLLTLNNGTEALLADFDLAAGTIEKVRIILGEGNAVVVGGDTLAMKVPSGSESGLKLKIDGEIEAGKNYKLVLDFDAAKSVVSAGASGKYLLKPVLYAQLFEIEEEETFGSISGIVYPGADSIASVVYLIQEDDSASTFPEESGYFLFANLEAGTYDVVAVPDEATGLDNVSVEDIVLGEAENIELDTLKF